MAMSAFGVDDNRLSKAHYDGANVITNQAPTRTLAERAARSARDAPGAARSGYESARGATHAARLDAGSRAAALRSAARITADRVKASEFGGRVHAAGELTSAQAGRAGTWLKRVGSTKGGKAGLIGAGVAGLGGAGYGVSRRNRD